MIGFSYGAVLDGIGATLIQVEADVSPGLPQFSIVGLPDSAVNESKLRIRSAIRNAGLSFPNKRITVNLSPASFRKRGAGLDLAIAVAILRADGMIPAETGPMGFAAELSLSGRLLPVPGLINLAMCFRRAKVVPVAIAEEQMNETMFMEGMLWLPCQSLRELAAEILQDTFEERASQGRARQIQRLAVDQDMTEVEGLEDAKHALSLAVLGHHHTLMIGPPGCGKTMLMERLETILPDLPIEHALEVYAIHEAAGTGRPPTTTPPVRMPHHTLTPPGMIGSGSAPAPGEATLAHRGVLVLDEVLEFPRATLDALREPLVQHSVQLHRNGKAHVFPAAFTLIGTLNPCRCGQHGFGICQCPEEDVLRYWRTLSGPMLDRLEMMIHVYRPEQSHSQVTPSIGSQVWRNRMTDTQAALRERESFAHQTSGIGDFDHGAQQLLERVAHQLQLSRRAQTSMGRLSRTISVWSGSTTVQAPHVEEAMSFRVQSPRQSSRFSR